MSATTQLTATGQGLAGLRLIAEADTTGPDAGFPSVSVKVNWNGDGVTFVEENTYVRAVSVTRGRSQLGDVFSAGTASVTLNNATGRFSPFNPAGPLYGGVVGGRAVAIVASYRGVAYPLYYGYTSEADQLTAVADPDVTLLLVDAFEQLRLSTADAALQQGQTTDACIAAVLAAAGFAGSTRLDGGRVLPLYAQPNGTVLQALQDLAVNELYGRVYIGHDGALVFENSSHRAGVAATLWLDDVEVFQQLQLRQADLYAAVQLSYGVLTYGVSGQVYRGQYGRALYPGVNVVSDHLTQAGYVTIATPAAESDYQVTDQQTPFALPPVGTGVAGYPPVDVTSSVAVLGFSAQGGTFSVTFWNSLPYTVYLTSLTVEGIPVQVSGFGRVYRAGAANSLVQGQVLSLTASALQDDAAAAAYVQTRAQTVATQHPRPVVQLVGKTPTLIHQILNLDLSQRIVLNDTTGGL